jgi:hypothetical protein
MLTVYKGVWVVLGMVYKSMKAVVEKVVKSTSTL